MQEPGVGHDSPRQVGAADFTSTPTWHLRILTLTREHIYRRHRIPLHCRRCFTTFGSENSLDQHSRHTICEVKDERLSDFVGINSEQEKLLRSRKRANRTEEDAWADMYRNLFPGAGDHPSPCKSNHPSSPPGCGLSLVSWTKLIPNADHEQNPEPIDSEGASRYHDLMRTKAPDILFNGIYRRLRATPVFVGSIASHLDILADAIKEAIKEVFEEYSPSRLLEEEARRTTESSGFPNGNPLRVEASAPDGADRVGQAQPEHASLIDTIALGSRPSQYDPGMPGQAQSHGPTVPLYAAGASDMQWSTSMQQPTSVFPGTVVIPSSNESTSVAPQALSSSTDNIISPPMDGHDSFYDNWVRDAQLEGYLQLNLESPSFDMDFSSWATQ